MPIFVWFLGKVVVMAKKRVLFISQEIVPYLPESEMANIGRYLPQGIQDKGKEIRTFMPRYGCINERRNQLHEVIRLSGMNLIINDTDHQGRLDPSCTDAGLFHRQRGLFST